MKEKNKAAKKAAKEKMDKEDSKNLDEDKGDKIAKSSIASENSQKEKESVSTPQEVVETAFQNGEQASIQIPNSTSAAEPTLKEKYAKAFGLEGFEIK